MTDFSPRLVAGLVVALAGLAAVALSVRVLFDRGFASRFLNAFAASARAHYVEQLIRLVAGAALVVAAPAMRFPAAFSVFGWVVIVTTVGLVFLPWRWHRRFARAVVPWLIRHRALYAAGLLALGAALLYGSLYGSLGGAGIAPAKDVPEVVEVFACGDYCPGPREQYLKRVYEGVSDAAQCRALGGEPFTYVGWTEVTICLAGPQ